MKAWLDKNLFAFFAFIGIILLHLRVPQVRNIWADLPFRVLWASKHTQEKGYAFIFILTVFALIAFYIRAWWIVATPPPAGAISFWKHPLRYLAELPARLAAPRGRAGRGRAALVCLGVGVGLLVFGYGADRWLPGISLYTSADLTLLDFGWELLLAATWFVVLAWQSPAAKAPPVPAVVPPPLGNLAKELGRFLTIVLLTTAFAEGVWVAAYYVDAISYRVYTIWAFFQLSFLIMISAHLLDVWHVNAPAWLPARPLSLTALTLFVLFLLAPGPVGGPATGSAPDSEAAKAPDWYQQVDTRLKSLDEHRPVVLVTASGGGSRAALFAALVLEALAHENLPAHGGEAAGTTKTWADQILLISSVSGGSLATAYYVNDSMRTKSGANDWKLRNSFQGALEVDSADQANSIMKDYYLAPWTGRGRNLHAKDKEAFDQKLKNARVVDPAGTGDWQWILKRRFPDDMCSDFMAPLLRGFLTPGLYPIESIRRQRFIPSIERGVSLSRFWENRFGWAGCDSLHGYAEAGYGSKDTLVAPPIMLNATHARNGSRVVIGFPPLPRGVFELPHDPEWAQRGEPTRVPGAVTLADVWSHHQISLAEAVRLSANFPWGLQTGRLTLLVPVVRKGKLGDLRKAFRESAKSLQPLFPNGNTLLDDPDGTQTDGELEGAVEESLAKLDAIRVDHRMAADKKKVASDFLVQVRQAGLVEDMTEPVDLLDGGVNDNTGLASLFGVMEHLHALAAQTEKDRDPLLDVDQWRTSHQAADSILKTLQRRGVILVEIDSGALVSQQETAEVKTPIQGLEAASQSLADTARAVAIRRLSDLLQPGNLGRGTPRKQVVYYHRFVCNHDAENEVMSAWALAPKDKAKVLGTFYCEYRQWKELDNPETVIPWLKTWSKDDAQTRAAMEANLKAKDRGEAEKQQRYTRPALRQ